MKYFLVLGLMAAAFLGGIYFENYRLVGEPDRTIAILLSKQAIDNANHQIKVNLEYEELLERQEYDALSEKIGMNTEVISSIKNSAALICEEVACSNEQQEYISGAMNSDG